jgi:hypothetical protein
MAETVTESAPKAETPAAQESLKTEGGWAKLSPEQVLEILRESGIKLAGASLVYGRLALENSARALDRAAQKLATLEQRLKQAPAAPAPTAG